MDYREKYRELLSKSNSSVSDVQSRMSLDPYDNIDVVLGSIVAETIRYESRSGKCSSEQVKEDVKENLKSAIDMMVYDCMFGNNDRHSQNWAMYTDEENGKAKLYPLYDNERVLGLSIPVADLKRFVASGDLETKTEENELSMLNAFDNLVNNNINIRNK